MNKRFAPLLLALLFVSLPLLALCPFCNPEVIERQLVAESDCSLVLYCLTPATEGHLLLIPKRHIKRFEELNESEMVDLYHLIAQTQAVFQQCYGLCDYVVVQKNGKNAGQSVDHVHFHVLPCSNTFDPTTFIHMQPPLTAEEMKGYIDRLKPYFQALKMCV
jgi:diadenosine tetraphosphate (Ap4A) HIT family hydrolase